MENDNENVAVDPVDEIEVETSSKTDDQIKALRTEAKNRRLELRNAQKESLETKAALEALRAEFAETSKTNSDRLIRAEIKAYAVKAGIADMEFLKLVDVSEIKINKEGDVEGAAELIAEYKQNKPHWFETVSTSSTSKVPEPNPATGKLAKDMTEEEYQAAKDRLIRMSIT